MAEALVMRRQQGFSYVVVMFLIGVLSLVSVRALENTLMTERRDLEAELLWRGQAYREAIRQYYVGGPGTATSYPHELKDLLYDERLVRPSRPLRKLYRDPMTPEGEWGLVHDGSGALIGVYSRSQVQPLKRSGFPKGLAAFDNAQHYSDWKFVYRPSSGE
jgi:type II secretory pathway pseudopilin PulG